MTIQEFVAEVVAFNGGNFLSVLPDVTETELNLLTSLAASI